MRAAVLAGQGVGVLLASYVSAETTAAWLVTAALSDAAVSSNVMQSAIGEHAAEQRAKAAGLDSVSIWLLTNDSVPDEAARRLTELSSSAVDGSAIR